MSRHDRIRGIWLALGVFALSRLISIVVAWRVAGTPGGPRNVLEVLTRWDAGFFISIAANGYPARLPPGTGLGAQSALSFFPGYPLAIRGISSVTGASPAVAGIIASLVAGAAACVLVWMLAARLSEPPTADRTVALFAFFPSAFVFSMAYSDSLYLLLAAACLLALTRERWLAAGVAAALAGLVRPNGLVLLPVCAVAAVLAGRTSRSWLPAVAPLLAPLGAIGFFAFLQAHTGTWLTFFHAQERGWDQRFDFGWSNLQNVIQLIARPRVTFHLMLLGLLVAGSVVAVWLMLHWRPPVEIVIYVFGAIAMVLGITITNSAPRLLLGAFPLLVPVARYTSRWTFAVILAASAGLMVAYFAVTSTTRLAP